MRVNDLGHRAYSPKASQMGMLGVGQLAVPCFLQRPVSTTWERIQPRGFSGWLKNRHVLHWPFVKHGSDGRGVVAGALGPSVMVTLARGR